MGPLNLIHSPNYKNLSYLEYRHQSMSFILAISNYMEHVFRNIQNVLLSCPNNKMKAFLSAIMWAQVLSCPWF